MSQCIEPNWNLKHQKRRQQQQKVEEEANRSSFHMFNPCNKNQHLVPMSNYEVAELTWRNGQLAMHGLNGFLPTVSTKPTCRSSDTLESIVHQATCQPLTQNLDQTPVNISPIAASSGRNCSESSGRLPVVLVSSSLMKKRARSTSDSDQCRKHIISCGIHQEDKADRSAYSSAKFYKVDNDATMVTSGSHEYLRSLKTKTTNGDSGFQDGSENRDETGRSHSTRRSRAAAIHNLSERKRRDRINQKMKALQKLVPNAIKTDKASMLDEVIEYLKQLQAQVQMMSMRSIPQMMMMTMPLGLQQQHLQRSILARNMDGIGVSHGLVTSMGLLDINAATMARYASQSLPPLLHLPPPFMAIAPPPMIPPSAAVAAATAAQPNPNASSNAPLPMRDPSCAFLTQVCQINEYGALQ